MRKYKRYSFLLACLLVLSMALAGCSGSSSNDSSSSDGDSDYPDMTIKLSHVVSEDDPKGQMAKKFKEVVEDKSDGNIKVKVYPNGQLYGDDDEIQALQSNNVQMLAPQTTKLAGFDEAMELFDIPFLFKDGDMLYKFEDSDTGQKLLDKLKSDGIQGLSFWPGGFKHMTNSKRPIKDPKDLKGLKIRTHGGDILNDAYKQMGAASTKIAFNDVYQALQLGTIDGEENNLSNIKSQNYDEVQKYMSLTHHTRTEYALIANKKWWDDLDDKTQDLLNEAIKTSTETGRDITEKKSDKALKEIKENGDMKVHELTDKEHQAFVDALKPVVDKWSEKLDPDIIDSIRDMQ